MNCDKTCKIGLCCQFIVFPIPKGIDKQWLLYHDTKIIGKSKRFKDHIIIMVKNKCKHLDDKGLCKIYHRRPKVCKDAGCFLKEGTNL